jgi:hypothetical protein
MKTIIYFLLIFIFVGIVFTSKSQKQKKTKIQIALILDTSSSMNGLIDQAKSQLWKVVNEMATAKYDDQSPDLEIALYEYGNDGLIANEGFIRLVAQMTTDLDKISEDLFNLKTNGGEEYCGQVIEKAMKQLTWTSANEYLKMIFIAGNEPFTQGTVDYTKSCQNAIKKGIIVNTIFCGNYQEGVDTKWKHGADLADGKYMNIDQNQTTAYVESPFDDTIVKLNQQLNSTYIAYGEAGIEKQKRQEVQDNNASSVNKGNLVNRVVSKSTKKYQNDSWDIVDASDKESFKVEEISNEELPAEMKKMNTDEKKKYIETKKKDRDKIQKQIADYNKKREDYVAKKQKENVTDNSLDAAMLKTVKEQATKKNYKFSK